MERILTLIDPSKLPLERDAALRFRWRLPGDDGAAAADSELIASVRQYGVIDPPILYGKTPIVVLGHRRLAAARQAGLERIDAFIVPAGAATRDEIASLWLEDMGQGAALSDLEKVTLTVKCREFLAEGFEVLLDRLEAAMGKALSIDYLDATGRVLELPEDILDSLHEGRLSTGDLLSLWSSDIEKTARILAGSSLNRKEQREAVRIMLRLKDMESEVWESFAKDYEMRGGDLLETLTAAAYPSLDRDLERIVKIVKGMGLPPGAAIHPPEHLEGGSYRLMARIRDGHSLAELLNKLRAALDDGRITQLLDILKGKQKK
jgi:ParB-like chromosome segregation protein Spo0J